MTNKNKRLTYADSKGFARLLNLLYIDKAIGKLYAYEEIGLSVEEIRELIIRVENLTERLKKMEDW